MSKRWTRALVTGASSGIGRAIARELVADGTALVLVARDRGRLEELAASWGGVECEVLVADLTRSDGCRVVEERLARGDVDLLVNNAGMGSGTDFLASTVEQEVAVVELNATALLRLTHAALGPMVAAGRGAVCNISSMAGFQPAPTAPTYAATKAFVTSLSESLHEMLRGTGVTVTAVCPGFTHTEFHARSGAGENGDVPSWAWMDAEAVARAALEAAASGAAICVPGTGYRVVAAVTDVLPRGARRRLVGVLSRRRGV